MEYIETHISSFSKAEEWFYTKFPCTSITDKPYWKVEKILGGGWRFYITMFKGGLSCVEN